MRRLLVAVLTTFAVLAAVPSPARAEASANDFLREIKNDSTPHLMILDAYGYGMMIAQVADEQRGVTPIFCLPRKMSMTPEQTADVLRRHIEANPATGEKPASIALLYALKATFPCS